MRSAMTTLTQPVAALCALILLVLLQSSCARLNSIHRTEDIPADKPHSIAIDAKQRVVLSNPVSDGAGKASYLRFCAEPPPDVFSAIASSLGANAGYALSAKDKKDIGVQFSAAMSENAATIERSQTVNILRESMYRNCERFLSGAISNDEFIVQAARDQRAMVSVLAIEQLTGVAKSAATALTTQASAGTTGATEAAIKAYDAAHKASLDLTAKADTARDAATKQAPAGSCDSLPAVDPANPNSAAELAAKKTKCEAADTADNALATAKNHEKTLQAALLRMAGTLAQAEGSVSTAEFKGSAASAALAGAVVDIVRENNRFDEIGMTCVVLFRNYAKNVDEYIAIANKVKQAGGTMPKFDDLFTKCLSLVGQMVDAQNAKSKAEQAEADARVRQFDSVLLPDDASTLWNLLDGGTDTFKSRVNASAAKMNALGRPLNPALLNALQDSGLDKAQFQILLGIESAETRRALIEAARSR